MSSLLQGKGEHSLISKKGSGEEANFDITAMIDLVFMMNIFFLVTTITAVLEELDLPAASHVVAADRNEAVVLSLLSGPDGARVFIGEAGVDNPVTNLSEQERQIVAAVEQGVRANQTTVLIKAEKSVRLKDIARVAGWASAIKGTELKLAVLEKE